MADKSIFRKESLDQMTSPDELDKYIRAVPVPMWTILIAVILLLAGALVWASVGYISVTMDVVVKEEKGQYSFTLEPEQYDRLTETSFVTIDGREYPLQEITAVAEDDLNISYMVTGECEDTGDRVFQAELTFEKMHPMAFILN